MKRCPECGRNYNDDSMSFCLDDGAELLFGPASMDEPATAIMSSTGAAPGRQVPVAGEGQQGVANSIAVLPFVNMSADVENDYFCDGLAEELLNALSRLDGLKVAARTSSFSYKNKNVNVGEIGRALGVKTILEGSVRKSAEHLRITVQLVNVRDGYHLWSERYDREMRDIFAVQDEITLAVVKALSVRLRLGNRSDLLKKATVNSEAFDLYLRARAFLNMRTLAGLENAVKHLELALERDPEYALAYVGLADCYSFLAYFEWSPPQEMASKARSAVEKALELTPGLAECHIAMGVVQVSFEFDFVAAERAYRTAISISPNLPEAHYLYCSTLAATGRFNEAINEGLTAIDLDPLSLIASTTLARVLCYAGRFDEAIDRIKKNLEIAPEFWFFHWILGVIYGQTGELALSVDHFQRAVKTGGFRIYSYLGVAYIRAGRQDKARKLLDELSAAGTDSFISPVAAGVIQAELGNMDLGLDLIEQAWQMRVIHLTWAGVDPVFNVFRGQPRFQAICRAIGVPV